MQKLRVGIIGCGAVTERYHLPACQRVDDVDVAAVVDVSEDRIRAITQRFGVPKGTTDYREILQEVDAVIISTPNHLHRPIGVDCLEHGVHVLCEKPLASSLADAQEMVDVARTHRVILAVGMIRRAYPGAAAMKALLQAGVLGVLTSFEVREGGTAGWPAYSLYRYDRALGGGCLMDLGPHLFDLLQWWMGDLARLESYKDDAWGGVEANALLRLVLNCGGLEVPGVVEISADRTMYTFCVRGSNGTAEMLDRNTVRLRLCDTAMVVPLEGLIHAVGREPGIQEVDYFVRQLDWFVSAVCAQEDAYVDGTEALKGLAIIEACYGRRELWLRPWESHLCDAANLTRLGGS